MGAQIVQHDDLSGRELRRELFGDVPFDGRRLHRALDQPRHAQAVGCQGCDQRGVLAMVARHRPARPPVMRRPAIQARQRRVRATLLDEDEPLGSELSDRLPPGGTRRLVALAGCQ